MRFTTYLKVILPTIVFLLYYFSWLAFFFAPIFGTKQKKEFSIPVGTSASKIAIILKEQEVFQFPYLFIFLSKLFQYANNINNGDYVVENKISLWSLFQLLQNGRIKDVKIQIIEGLNAQQIFAILKKSTIKNNGNYDFFFSNENFLRENNLPLEVKNLEGFLFPDTYKFSKYSSEKEILQKMVTNFYKKIENFENNTEYSFYELLILASIIEKETSVNEEKKLIASVFFNRLKQSIRLQTDPTVIYGIANFDGNLTKKHLRTYTPYNTYRIKALPPTPISNPGLIALQAVYAPAQTKYLYFVGKGDGKTHFSTTLQEHNRAVYLYQKKRNKNYQSF